MTKFSRNIPFYQYQLSFQFRQSTENVWEDNVSVKQETILHKSLIAQIGSRNISVISK